MTAEPSLQAESEALSSAQRKLRVSKAVQAAIGTDVAQAKRILGHSLYGGKGMRALVAHLSCEYCGISLHRCDKIAAAIEMIHVASLLHDDVVDQSDTRRYKASANARFGNLAAVLAGDFLYSRASQMLCRDGSPALLAELADATNRLAEGELLQLAESGDIADESVYMDMIERKTAALFAAAAVSGPAVSGSEGLIEPLRCAGTNLGLAFQIADDCIDYASDEKVAGKKAGGDFTASRTTLPLLYGLRMASADDQRLLHKLFVSGNATAESFAQVKQILEQCGAIEAAQNTASEYAQKTIDQLAQLEDAEQLNQMRKLAKQVARRLR